MRTTFHPGMSSDAIQAAIDASQEGDYFVFESGEFVVERTLRFPQGRYYRADHCIFRAAPTLDGPAISVYNVPRPKQSIPRRVILWLRVHLLRQRWLLGRGAVVDGFTIIGPKVPEAS